MRVLVIDEEFPWPLNTGKRTRSFSLTKALAERDDVSYLAYGEADSDAVRAMEACGITCHCVPPPDRRQEGPKFYAKLLMNLVSSLPYIVSSHYTERFARRLAEVHREKPYDLVVCEWSPYSIFLKSTPELKSVIVAHNIEADIWRRYEENETNPLRRWYISIQRAKVESFERNCFSWSHGATAVTDADAQVIASYGVPYPVRTVENGVDVGYFVPTESEPDPDALVFTGSMDWRPNQDAVEFFVKEVFPGIRRERPGARITVVGRRPPRSIQDLGHVDGVTITGTVDDVRPFVEEAAVFVVPLRIGGGSRLKILEAMAMGKPVLSTSVGAEGLQVTDGQDIVLADGAEAFARATLELLDDRERQRRIARAGRALVEQRYHWDRLADVLHGYLIETLARST
ncbi:MAG: glycosyltransferase [Gemmatimonadetes bacterium]|nr:glycosyltransferase [Gemmatimonadota bacterium]